MVTARELAQNDERYVIGQWFESMSAAVKAYPMRAGTQAGKVIAYDKAIVSELSKAFNLASQSRNIPSRLEQAAASRHLYHISKAAIWGEPDVRRLETAAQDFRNGSGNASDPSFAASYLLERMKRLYQVCKLNRIGVSVHTPEPGLIQIELVPQERPVLKYVPKAPKLVFGK